MNSTNVWLANKKVYYWIAFVLCLITSGYLLSHLNPAVVTYGDTLSYWAAGRLFVAEENPYSVDLLMVLRHETGEVTTQVPSGAIARILYPPWTLPFVAPIGLVTYPAGRLLWFIIHLVVVFFCARWIWELYHGPRALHWVAYLVAFTLWPVLFNLLMGHFTTLHLLGLIGFIYYISRPGLRAWDDLAAGACAALVTFKPQLLYLFMLALLLWIIQQRRWLVLAGGATFVLVFSAIAVLVDPHIFSQFWTAVTAYDAGIYASPALGTVLRRALDYQREWLQLLPPLLGLTWFIYYWIKHYHHWDWFEQMPVLILASFFSSAYMWSYDMVVLLLPILQMTITLIKSQVRGLMIGMFVAYTCINGLVFFQFIAIHNDYYSFWLVPALLAWWLLGNYLARPGLNLQFSQD